MRENVNETPCIESKERDLIIANMQWLEEEKKGQDTGTTKFNKLRRDNINEFRYENIMKIAAETLRY